MKDDINNQLKIKALINEITRANKELLFQNEEKEKRAAELVIANKELMYLNEEKEKRAAELVIANKELMYQNQEKEKRAAEILFLKDSLFIEKQLLEKTLFSIGDAVISTDENYNVVFLNMVAEQVTGWTQKEAFGKSVYDVFKIFDEFTRVNSEDIIKKVMISGEIHMLANHTILVTKDRKEIIIEDSAAPILNENNKSIGVVIVFRDYTEKWERLKKIEYLSLHDELTGLHNRRFYEEAVKKIDTKSNMPISIIMGDINGLKLINDSFGHDIGDQLLIKTANAIKEGCRGDDIIARIGGDEFIIVLPNSDALETEEIINRIQNIVAKQTVENIQISISFGYGIKNNVNTSIDDIFKVAENNMYEHKVYESASLRSKTIELISSTLFAKNSREHIHSQKVSELSEAIAIKMGFNSGDIKMIKLAGLMHDIGKIGIEDKILNKCGKLNKKEMTEIKRHPEIAYRILNSVNDFSGIALFVLEHHEKWDGTGYPQGLKGEGIKIESRIIGLADSYSAMTNERTYGKVLNKEDAIKEIKRSSGTQFDPEIVNIFIKHVLNDGNS